MTKMTKMQLAGHKAARTKKDRAAARRLVRTLPPSVQQAFHKHLLEATVLYRIFYSH